MNIVCNQIMKTIIHIYIFYSIIIKSYQCILFYIKKDFYILILVKKKMKLTLMVLNGFNLD